MCDIDLCTGAMYNITVEASEFKGQLTVKQHRVCLQSLAYYLLVRELTCMPGTERWTGTHAVWGQLCNLLMCQQCRCAHLWLDEHTTTHMCCDLREDLTTKD